MSIDDLVAAIFGEQGSAERKAAVERLDAPRRALRELTATRKSLDGLEAELVRQARLAGTTWAQIAHDLAVSRPTAQRRHVAFDPQRRRRPARPIE